LERDVSVANSQVKQRDKELKQLRGMVQELQTLKERLELERAELDKRCEDILVDTRRIKEAGEQNALLTREELLRRVREAFGDNSDLTKFIIEANPEFAISLGYACLYSLPRMSLHMGAEPGTLTSVHSMVALANKFLENVREFDETERTLLLTVVADHLSRVSQMFTFRNEEGQLYNPDRHSAKSGQVPAQGGRVRRIASFWVGNNKTKQTLQKAEVLF
ncbi:MAG: hypothetical protein V2B18_08175, partial [Pseudomonadota bacterium]